VRGRVRARDGTGARTGLSSIPTTTLNNGVEMPMLGFGVFQIPEDDTERCVLEALETGYRMLDTAASYENEEAVGRAVRQSGIPRDELFITTKIWIQSNGDKTARQAFENSLRRLRLEYVDLITSRWGTTTASGARWRNCSARSSSARSASPTSTSTGLRT
jgi:diketogulonate reductase-like aldo/keto reductase